MVTCWIEWSRRQWVQTLVLVAIFRMPILHHPLQFHHLHPHLDTHPHLLLVRHPLNGMDIIMEVDVFYMILSSWKKK